MYSCTEVICLLFLYRFFCVINNNYYYLTVLVVLIVNINNAPFVFQGIPVRMINYITTLI